MTLDDKERDTLIRYRLGQAEETIIDVELLIDNNRFRAAVNRIMNFFRGAKLFERTRLK